MFSKIVSIQIGTLVLVLLVATQLYLQAEARVNKDDCDDLWNVVRGQGDAMNSRRKLQTKGIALEANSVLRLYQDCLVGEDGYRYRRSSPPSSIGTIQFYPKTAESQVPQLDSQPDVMIRSMFGIPEQRLGTERIIEKLKKFLGRM